MTAAFWKNTAKTRWSVNERPAVNRSRGGCKKLSFFRQIEACGLIYLLRKYYFMRAAARLLFWRENRLCRQTGTALRGGFPACEFKISP